jgi:putative transposase
VILVFVSWYTAYLLSYRYLEEIMEERGVSVDHSSINRWAIRFLPPIEKMTREHKRPVGGGWRLEILYHAVGKQDKAIDFRLPKRNMAAAKRFFEKAMGAIGAPSKIAIDKSGADRAAIDAINAPPCADSCALG